MIDNRALAAVVFAALALFSRPAMAADSYKVSAQIAHKGAPVGSPTLMVKEGVPGSVSMTGDNGYTLQVTVDRGEQETVELAAQLVTRHGSVSTTVVTKPGKPVKLSTGEIDFDLTVEAQDD